MPENVEQCAQMVRQRISHNRSTPQVTDQGLPGEHKKCCVWRRKRGLQWGWSWSPTLTAEFGEEHAVLTSRRSAEVHVFGENIVLVATRDVLSFASVYHPDSFPAESTCVSLWSAQCELCGCCCSALRVLCESCPAHQVLVFLCLVDASAHLVHETVCS